MLEITTNPHLLRWVENRLAEKRIRSGFKEGSIGLVAYGDDIYGAVVFHDFNGSNVQLSIATSDRRWATKEFIRTCFAFVFNTLKAKHCMVCVREDNEDSLRLCRKLGFKEEGVMRQSVIDTEGNTFDGVIMGMLENECRWL